MLGATYVEYIHDELIMRVWPGSDPIAPGEYRDRKLLESATARPFQSAGGQDAYPTIQEKATALFHSLIANHAFHNGNKRAASIALGLFLVANGFLRMLTDAQTYRLAEEAASYRERGLTHEQCFAQILGVVTDSVTSLTTLRSISRQEKDLYVLGLYTAAMRARRSIRTNPLNRLIPAD